LTLRCTRPLRGSPEAAATIAAATRLYLRYDGTVGGGTDNHVLNVGLRMSS
jgi:hypothetical protein